MAKRVDTNQKEIVEALRELGVSVQILSDVGKGCPDLVVGFRGRNYLLEIKDGKRPPSQQKLTEHEERFFDNWRGQVDIVKSVQQAIDFICSKNRKILKEDQNVK